MSQILPQIDQFSIIEIYTRNAIKLFKVIDSRGNCLALKMLQEDTPQKIKQFEKEISILKSLSHIPSVPKVHTIQKFHGNVYYTMDYIDGMSLLQYITHHKRLSETATLRIIKDIADIVNKIHKKDVIHCDLSPANIMLQNDKVFIIDFGIALTEKDLVMSKDREFKGTLNYISPEQANGEYSRIGFWSDIYSLGAITYHMITGVPPFYGENNIEIMHNIAQNNLRQLNDYQFNISTATQCIIHKALQHKISSRYTNTKDFLSDLLKVLPGNYHTNLLKNQDLPGKEIITSRDAQLPKTMCFDAKNPPDIPFVEKNVIPMTGEICKKKLFFSEVSSSQNILTPEKIVSSQNISETTSDNKLKLRTGSRRATRNTQKQKSSFSLIVGICIGITTALVFAILFFSSSREEKKQTQNTNTVNNVNIDEKNSTRNVIDNELENKNTASSTNTENNNPWLTPVQIGSLYHAQWTLENDIWYGTSDKSFGLMVIRDFTNWQNYTFTAEFYIVRGKLGIFMRGFASTAQFPDFMGQMGIANPKNQWYTVTAIANGSRLSVSVDGINKLLTSVDSTLENSGVVGFGLQPEFANIPALVYVKNIKLQKLP